MHSWLAKISHRPPVLEREVRKGSTLAGRRRCEQLPQDSANRLATALAGLSVADAGERLALDWDQPLRHATFYKAVYRPAILRANRLTPDAELPPELKFHSLRHTHASLCVAAGIPPERLSRRMGHAKIGTTLGIYVHLLPDDDAAEDMAALDALGAAPVYGGNVLPLPLPLRYGAARRATARRM